MIGYLRRLALGTVGGLFSLALPVHGAVIDSTNGTPNFGVPPGTSLVNKAGAADFRLDAAAQLTDVHFWTTERSAIRGWYNNEDLEYYLWQQSGAPGGALVASGDALNVQRVVTNYGSTGCNLQLGGEGYDCVAWDFDLASAVSLQANTTYWLGLYVRNWGEPNPPGVFWTQYTGTGAGSNDCSTSGNGTNLTITSQTWTCPATAQVNFAFYLTGTTTSAPEPTTLALLGLGLAGLAAARRRKQ